MNTTRSPSRQSDRLAVLLDFLMVFYPRRFRLLHREGLVGMWRESYPTTGTLRRLGYWARVLGDSLASGIAARWEESRESRLVGRGAVGAEGAEAAGGAGGAGDPGQHGKRRGTALGVEALWQDVRFGFRTLWKSRGFTAVIVLTLALGIGANTAIFSVVNGILLRALPYEDPDRLVTLWEVMERGSDNHVSLHNFLDWQEQSRSFAALAVHPSYSYSAPTTILGADAPTRVWVADVSRDFFAIFQARPALGRWPFAEEFEVGATQTAVVSYRFWQNQLGATPAFNERVLQIGSMSVPVVGVMPPGFSYPKETDVWVTTDVEPYPHPMARTGHNWAVIARLRDGVSLSEARTEMNSLAARLKEQWGETNDAVAVSVTRLQDELVGSYKRPLYLLLGAAGLVLLVACANIASTLMARGTARARELAVRASLGAGRRRLVRQLFTESLLLSGLGTAAGIVLAVVVLRGLLAVGPAALAQTGESGLDARAMIFALAVAFVASVVFGLFPAFRASKTDVTEALSSVGRGNAGAYHRGLWSFLVGSEVALAVLLLVGSGLLIKSFWEVLSVHPGFDSEDLLTVQVSLPASKYPDDQSKAQFHQAFLQQIAETPGVTGAGIINHLPLSGVRMSGQFLMEGRVDEEAGADYRIVDRGYFDARRAGSRGRTRCRRHQSDARRSLLGE